MDFLGWSERDQGLAVALVTLEEQTTPEGAPVDIAYDDELGTYINVERRTNWAKYALSLAREEHKDAPDYEEMYLTYPTAQEAVKIRADADKARAAIK